MLLRKVYIATSFENRQQAIDLAIELRKLNVEITSTWHDEAPIHIKDVQSVLNDNKEEDNIDWCTLNNWAEKDLESIERSNGLVFIHYDKINRGGSHVEFGYAMGNGLKLYYIGRLDNVFNMLDFIFHFDTIEEFLSEVDDGVLRS